MVALDNTGALRGSRMGREIDRHEAVFRFKFGMTRGFEDDVGRCSSLRFIRSTAGAEAPQVRAAGD